MYQIVMALGQLWMFVLKYEMLSQDFENFICYDMNATYEHLIYLCASVDDGERSQ